uniref:HYDIN/VesB/CFA65-like Ig-like domain-containing protein n=1 Tax=Geospiza parvula TaxID=87175 RepID=A0A8U8ATG8_GEOPR
VIVLQFPKRVERKKLKNVTSCMQMTWFRCSVSMLLVLTCLALPSQQTLPNCPRPQCWSQTGGIQAHPCECCACACTAESALGKGPRRDVSRARTGLLWSCFHKWQNHHLMSLLQVPRLVKVCMESCPYFQLACPSHVHHMVPPGASAPVRIRFSPDENKDYSHELTCLTAREKIVVPIRAIGARAVLDFPAQVDFSECPVKHSTQQTLLVRNVGTRTAHYQLSTQSPFSVVPAAGALGAGDTVQVTVAFHALTHGDYFGSLCCNTGECWLHGEAVDIDVVLSTNSVQADKTFITMSNETSVFIENKSNIPAHFQWKAFPSEGEENKEKRRRLVWKMHFSEIHGPRLKLTYGLRGVLVQKDPLLFSNDIFFIEPMEGEIGPNCSAEIKVTFTPLEAQEYGSVAYCSISGRESRLPLQLRGEGQGPLVELSSPTLNLGNVFVHTPYVYEVKLINQGALDAAFTYIPSATHVALGFKLEPKEGIIAPGGTQTVQISFHTTMLGSFEEKFQFRVAESPTPSCHDGCLNGCLCPFLGFPYTQRCRLTNCSVVPVMFKLRMSDDGTQPAVDSLDQIHREGDPSWRKGIHFYVEPKEFTINPSQGIILPQGQQDIEVTLCSNTVMEFHRRLLVDVEGFGEGVATLTITARYQPLPGLPRHCLAQGLLAAAAKEKSC